MRRRIPLKERSLPTYTKGEEIFNMVSHIVGGAIGIAALTLCVVLSAVRGSVAGVLCGTTFGVSMIVLYTMSSIYHGLPSNTAKKVFQIMDHCTIYFLIAGTYTPILICGMAVHYPVAAWITFGAVWGLAALASVLTAIDIAKYKAFSMICYIGMGWSVIPTLPQAMQSLGIGGFSLVLGGGIFYTVGAIFFKIGKKKPYFHSIFHILTLFGSVCHVLAILFFVLW